MHVSSDGAGNTSWFPVRYFDGLPILKSTDLVGESLSHTRSWSGYQGTVQGFGWESSELPRALNL